MMRRIGWWSVTAGLPLLYLAAVYVATRHPKPVYAFAVPTVFTVAEKAGPAIYHAPDPIYPAQALRAHVEGSVRFHVAIAADGSVRHASLIAGPAPLVDAALTAVRQYQFEPKAAETEIEIPFSLQNPTRSFSLPAVAARPGAVPGPVRVVVSVDPAGHVDSVTPVAGREALFAPAMEAVRRWTFRPALRNGAAVKGSVVIDIPRSRRTLKTKQGRPHDLPC
ncbi:MAG TPA: TonB family protein [Candidatus Acidoferrales bacterium]|nr:TonB family protein [Candidatus Acidoferrales bacterium]